MYNVGDRVIVRDDLKAYHTQGYKMTSGPNKGFRVAATDLMVEYAGQEVTIAAVCDREHWAYGTYLVDETDDRVVWTDEMFSGLAGPTWDAESITDLAQLFQ